MRRSAIIINIFFLLFFSFFAKILKIFEENFISPFFYLSLTRKHFSFSKNNLFTWTKWNANTNL